MDGWPSVMKVGQMIIPPIVPAGASHTAQDSYMTKIDQKEREARRASYDIRGEHLEAGAFLIEFTEPKEPFDMFRRPVPATLRPAHLLVGKELKSVVDKYRTMERKGFQVTKDTGCLIPHAQYSTSQQGATIKGHQRSFAFFARWSPSGEQTRNELGWPSTLQISHLCHRRGCCRPDHLIVEEQWRNLKRNYCGHSGSCDCGNELKCLKRYQMQDQEDEPELCTSKEDVLLALQGAPPFVVHGKDRFKAREAKGKQRKENREKRKRKQEQHTYATDRKQARLSEPGAGALASVGQEGVEQNDSSDDSA